jgi:hypothetical protein
VDKAPHEPRIVRIADGLFAEVVDRSAVLPPHLEPLLNAMRGVCEVPGVVLYRTRRACMENEHALQPWRQGVYRSVELRLSLCAFCGAVEVRDVSLDILPISTQKRRRDAVLGWYAGRRPAGRTYGRPMT